MRSLSTPEHAVLNETVEATRILNKDWASKVVNAVLRRYQRDQESIDLELQNDPEYRYNHPIWMIDKLKNNWPRHWESILSANDLPPPLCLRINTQKTNRAEFSTLLNEADISHRDGMLCPEALYLDKPRPVDQIPKFEYGWVSVQDEAAQLCAHLLNPQPGERVLDACAAPGGKLCHLLEQQTDLHVDALEIEPRRAKRIEENLKRLGLSASLLIGDAQSQDWWNGEAYDRILVDAPCSATGVIRRNPDIKLLRKNEDIAALAKTQLAILNNLWSLLRPGGTLIYATCSIFPQENERIVERFMKQHPDAEHLPIQLGSGEAREFGHQIFPDPQGQDGFFYARLKRNTLP